MDLAVINGSLVAIFQASSNLVRLCYKYGADIKNLRIHITSALDEIVGIRTTVEKLLGVLDYSDDGTSCSPRAITRASHALESCVKELENLELILTPETDLESEPATLSWSFTQNDLEAGLATLRRVKATLQPAVGTNTYQYMAVMLAEASTVPGMQEPSSQPYDTLEQAAEVEQKAKLLAKLPTHCADSRHREYLDRRVNGTGEWMVNHKGYKEWRTTEGSLLWLTGSSGSGKTMLCSRIIEDLQSMYSTDDDVAIVYFYIDGSERQPLTVNTLYHSFLHQLCLQIPGIPHTLEISLRYKQTDAEFNDAEIRHVWPRTLQEFSRIFMVIDGVDECQEFIKLDDMVELLKKLLGENMRRTNILASSRPVETLRHSFQSIDAMQISMEDESAGEDLKTALYSWLSSEMPFRRWPQGLRDIVQSTLLSKADGSFYWVTCQLSSLRQCMTPASVKEKLQSLPSTLEQHYSGELERLQLNNGQSVRNILRWMVLSFRPLSIAELVAASAINVQDHDEPSFDAQLELLDIDAFLESCSSIMTTHQFVEGANDQLVFVKFAHFSVLEFLRSDALNAQGRTKLSFEGGLNHSLLAKSCLAYIHSLSADDTDEAISLPVFMKYAASSWLEHKQLSSDSYWALPTAQSLLQPMFDSESNSYSAWLKHSSINKPYDRDNWTRTGRDEATQQIVVTKSLPYVRVTPAYCAAFAGVEDIVKEILKAGADPNVKCGTYAYALQAAAAFRHVGIVEALIAAGADVDGSGGIHGSALSAASTAGHVEVVRMLLKVGAKPQVTRVDFVLRKRSPLLSAARGGHLEIINLLLDHGAQDHHDMKGNPCTAFSAAVQSGRLDIVRTMLRHEHIRSTNEYRREQIIRSYSSGMDQGLFYAVTNGHKHILRELSDRLTDAELLRYAARVGDMELVSDAMVLTKEVDAKGKFDDHPRALQSAARGGHLAVVKQLLALGADPNNHSDYSTAIDDCIHGGNLEVARVLIEAGADVHNGTPTLAPLTSAMYARKRDFMELFVAHGASTHPCLLIAAWSGDLRTFMVLLALGADIHQSYPESERSLMQAAAFGGSIGIVRYLLDHGVDLQSPTQTHPLTEAIRSRHILVVRCLLNRGANVNAAPTSHEDPGSWGGVGIKHSCWPPLAANDTPLSAAVKIKDIDLVEQLLDMGAHSNSSLPETCGTPLLLAVWEEDIKMVELLLKHKADAGRSGSVAKRKKACFPLLLAAEKGNYHILTMLLDADAPINQQDAEGYTALHVSTSAPNIDGFHVLVLDYGADTALRLSNGSQVVHTVASNGDVERLEILVTGRADINSQDKTGRTPLHYAADNVKIGTLAALLDLGADATVMADDGKSSAWDLLSLAMERPTQRWADEYEEAIAEEMKDRLKQTMIAQQTRAKAMGHIEDAKVAG